MGDLLESPHVALFFFLDPNHISYERDTLGKKMMMIGHLSIIPPTLIWFCLIRNSNLKWYSVGQCQLYCAILSYAATSTAVILPDERFIIYSLSLYFQGYVIYSIRNKLKKQYIHLKGKQIEKLKNSGVEVSIRNDHFIPPVSVSILTLDFLDHRHDIISRGCIHGRHNVRFFARTT